MFAKLRNQFEEAINIFIRPPKHDYELEELGKNPLQIKGETIIREDITLKNSDNHSLHCSFFQIKESSSSSTALRPCIIYLHCNAGSRCEVMPLLSNLIAIGANVFAFDMSGCGYSEGDYVTLGYKESLDVKIVVEYLKKNNKASTIGLWGRSMGAVTALKYAVLDSDLAVLILDSPFSNLNKLACELAKEKTGIPGFLLPMVLGIVKKGIKKRVDIKFGALDLTKFVHDIKIPSIYLYSYHDEIVKPYHIEKLFELHGCSEKRLFSVKGRHNDARPKNILKEITRFCSEQFAKKDKNYQIQASIKEISEKKEEYDKNFKKEISKKDFDILSKSSEKNKFFMNIDWDVPQISEEFPRLMSNVSLLSQNETKFLGNKESFSVQNVSFSSKNSTENNYKLMNNYEDNSEKLPGVAAFSGKFTQSTGVLNLNTKENNINISPLNKSSDKKKEDEFFTFEKKPFEIKIFMN